jgi:hypothetical protein
MFCDVTYVVKLGSDPSAASCIPLRICTGPTLPLAPTYYRLLDTLKDPIFGQLVGGNLERHQPPAKLLSVCTTLLLVCFLENLANEENKQQQQEKQTQQRSHDEVLDGGGQWSRMGLTTAGVSDSDCEWKLQPEDAAATNTPSSDQMSSRVFMYVCLPYCIFFAVMASLLQFNPVVALAGPTSNFAPKDNAEEDRTYSLTTIGGATYWHVIGYCLFAATESFGSLAVATFWSYTNSTLSLEDAEQFYGVIIALAQLGAILGSTMVTTHVWSSITLIVLACLIILLHGTYVCCG